MQTSSTYLKVVHFLINKGGQIDRLRATFAHIWIDDYDQSCTQTSHFSPLKLFFLPAQSPRASLGRATQEFLWFQSEKLPAAPNESVTATGDIVNTQTSSKQFFKTSARCKNIHHPLTAFLLLPSAPLVVM